jgi:hypothetical protein
MVRRIAWVLLTAWFAAGCTHSAGVPATQSGSTDSEQGFVPLLNGKDLGGWRYRGKVGEGYRVREDGVLYCTADDGGMLFTEKQYDDFILRFEFRLTPAANNGIAIRAPMRGRPSSQGIEIQVLDDTAPEHADIRPAQHHGSVYDVVPARPGHQKPLGQWNEEEIIAHGSHITVKLNGATIVDTDLSTIKDPQVLAKHPGVKNRTGHIGFLGHGTPAEFRNMRIKPLG